LTAIYLAICLLANYTGPLPIAANDVQQNCGPLPIVNYSRVYSTPLNLEAGEAYNLILKEALTSEESRLNYGFRDDFFWVHFSINWQHTKQEQILLVNNPHTDLAVLYSEQAGDWEELGRAGDRGMRFKDRSILHHQFLFKLPPQDSTTSYLLKVDKRATSVSLPLFLSNTRCFESYNQKQTLYHGTYFGLLALAVLLGLAMAIYLKKKVYLYYSLLVICNAFYMFTELGYAFEYLYPNSLNFNNYMRLLCICGITFSGSMFVMALFNLKQHTPGIQTYIRVLNACLLALLIGWYVFTEFYRAYSVVLINMLYVMAFIYLALMAKAVYLLRHTHQRLTLNFTASISVLVAGYVLAILVEYGFIETWAFTVPPTFTGAMICLLILGLSMGKISKDYIKQREQLQLAVTKASEAQESLEDANRLLANKIDNQKITSITLKSKAVIPVNNILYVASDGHYLDIYLTTKTTPETDRNNLKDLHASLPQHLFVQIHRKYLVNTSHVKHYNSKSITLKNGTRLSLSRTYKDLFYQHINAK
jgi:hypothetical protein